MRYFMSFKPEKTMEEWTPPSPETMAALGAFTEEMTKSGILVSTGGILPSSKGARIVSTGGMLTVTDGPFPETKEVIIGWAIIDVKSKEEAVEVGKRFMLLTGDDGVGDLLQMMEGPPPSP